MDAGGKRCLPTWMLRKCSSRELEEVINDKNRSQVPNPAQAGALETGKKGELTVRLDDSSGSSLPSETVRRSRKYNKLDANHKIANRKSGLRKNQKGKAVRKRGAWQEASSYGPKNVDLEAPSTTKSEDDEELTVEDLVSIAEEYVNADKEGHLLVEAGEDSNSVAPTNASVSSKNNTGLSDRAAQNSAQISKCTTTYSSSISSTGTVERTTRNITKTSDEAQGMLDVLLGPLLRMPTDETNIPRKQGEDECMTYEHREQHRENLTRDENNLPLTKNKSTVKDMMEILLSWKE